MSSSTVQRLGAKTYSRSKESSASRAFDEIVANKPPIKAASTHTKWGKTNFKALRESQRLRGEATSQAKKPRLEEQVNETGGDPFNFDGDAERKRSPTKRQAVVAKPVVAARLPGTRIVTRSAIGEGGSSPEDGGNAIEENAAPPQQLESDEDEEFTFKQGGEFAFKQGLAVSKRTYTRAPFANPVEVKKKLVTTIQPIDPARPVSNFGFDESAVISSDEVESDSEVSFNFKMPQFMKKEAEMKKLKEDGECDNEDEGLSDDDDDMSSVAFKKQPVRTYGSAKQPETAVNSGMDVPDESSAATGSVMPTAITRGPHSPRRASRYSDPKLLQEYKRMYVEKTGKQSPDAVGDFSNSTVVSKACVKGNKGTTLIVVCKPKGVKQANRDTVQHKYFGNPSKVLGKSSLPLKAVVDSDECEAEVEEEAAKSPSAQDSKLSNADSIPRPSQPITYGSRTQANPNSMSTVRVRNKIFRSMHGELKSSSSESPVSSQDSGVSESSTVTSCTDSSGAPSRCAGIVKDTKPAAKPGAKRSYRIFKSRAPPTELKEEPVEPPKLEPEPPTLEPARVVVISPPVSPPCLSVGTEEEAEVVEEEEEDEVVLIREPREPTPPIPGTNDKNNSATAGAVESMEVEMESDSQSVASEESHDSQEDVQGTAPVCKRKIFKTKTSRVLNKSSDSLRRKVLSSPKKLLSGETRSPNKAVYNARSWQGNLDAGGNSLTNVRQFEKKTEGKSAEVKKAPVPQLTRSVHWPSRAGDEAYTSLRVTKEHRQLFTVVRNVKEAFEVQESGETQDFMDDVEYLLDSLHDTEPMSIRCLSCVQLAGKCTMPAFRMHLRAHGTMTKIFNLLHDANKNPSLSLSTATMMYMLSKDRLNMDLEQESLNLMLRLLEVDSEKHDDVLLCAADLKELERMKVRVHDLCEQMQDIGPKLDLDTISTGNLAMESLLSLTSRKAGEWFKEELRSVGALDHIVDTVSRCSCYVELGITSNEKSLSNLKKLDRCLRVLENITYMNTDNQTYVISYKEALLVTSICKVLRACEASMPLYPVTLDPEKDKEVKESLGYVIISCVLSILRVLLNVTHDNEYGSTKVGEQGGLMECALLCVFSTSKYAPTDQKFDILVLCLGLLINMVEHCLTNRRRLMDMDIALPSGSIPAITAILKLFFEREKCAHEMDEKELEEEKSEKAKDEQNKSGEWQESEAGVQWIVASAQKLREQQNNKFKASQMEDEEEEEEAAKPQKEEPSVLDEEETFTQALHKAGKHMENSIIASYVALLIGCLIQDNMMYVNRIREHLPDGSFEPLIKVLKKFLGFMNLTKAIDNSGGQPIARVIEILEAC